MAGKTKATPKVDGFTLGQSDDGHFIGIGWYKPDGESASVAIPTEAIPQFLSDLRAAYDRAVAIAGIH